MGLLNPLQPNLISIPIKCIWSNSGNCTIKIMQQIKQVFNVMKASSLEITGSASDGDPQYLKIGQKPTDELRSVFGDKMSSPLTNMKLASFEL